LKGLAAADKLSAISRARFEKMSPAKAPTQPSGPTGVRHKPAAGRKKQQKEVKPLEEFVTSTLQTGFSIAVAAYLLIRMERRLYELSLAINNLEKGVAKYFAKP